MRCPYCAGENTQVKDSRPTEENAAIRRRRVCPDCGGRFTTFERVQLRELLVVKRSGRKVAFDRDKLMRSVDVALRKRPIDRERVERMVSGLVRQLESAGRERGCVLDDRRPRHGGAARARPRRLRALCLRLSRFPRGVRFPRGARRDCRRAAPPRMKRRTSPSRAPLWRRRRSRSIERDAPRGALRLRRPDDADRAGRRGARARTHGAQSFGRRGHRR